MALVALLLGLLGTAAAPWLLRPRPNLTAAACERIAVGADEAAVAAVLGGRAGDYAGPGRYVITDPGGRLRAVEARRFVAALEPEPEGVQQWWLSDDGLIVVQFDGAGRTTRKAFYPVWFERRGFLPQVRDWLGF